MVRPRRRSSPLMAAFHALMKLTRRSLSQIALLASSVGIFGLMAIMFLHDDLQSYDFNSTSSQMTGFVMKTPPRKFTKVPEGHSKTFYTDGHWMIFPIIRGFRNRGWRKVNQVEDAHAILTDLPYLFRGDRHKSMKPWQRYNHVPNIQRWNNKESFIDGFDAYEEKVGRKMFFLPESYRLNRPKDMEAFERRLKREGGIDRPWVLKKPDVNKGKGIEMLAPNSRQLLEVPERIKNDTSKERYIIQEYICNELTWNHRKFDVRMYWYVASLDPLVVMYHDGYVRIGHSVYDETDFNDTRSHLTSSTYLGEESKASFADFCERILDHHRASPELRHIKDAVQHVKNQFKHALAETIAAFEESSFSAEPLSAENGMGFYGADYILDQDLDVWFIEPQMGCGLHEDLDLRVELNNDLFRPTADMVEEVWRKQEEGKPVLPFEKPGKWEVIYADRWQYTYEGYNRANNKKGCTLAKAHKRRP